MDTAFPLGSTVWVEDVYSAFEGTYLGDTPEGLCRVLDPDTGDILVGNPDFVEVIA